jgi:hypothetical protein
VALVLALPFTAATAQAEQAPAPVSGAPGPGAPTAPAPAPGTPPPTTTLEVAAPRITATRVERAPVLDGKLDDAVWAAGKPSSAFTQKTPDEGSAPTAPTTITVLYDNHALYVGFDCKQEAHPIVARLTRRDREIESDWVSVAFDSRNDGKSAYEFQVNAAGVLIDSARSNDVENQTAWDENWEARTSITAGGWTAELRIPFKTLRYSSAREQSWGIQARRNLSARHEVDELAFIPRAVAAEVSRYARLDGLSALQRSAYLELRPFVVARLQHRRPSYVAVGEGTSPHASAGLDVKLHVSDDLTIDAAFNPDFAQVESDEAILNLSTYEVYRAEKRPFLLEGSDIIAPQLSHLDAQQIVYTRRVGHVPPLDTELPVLRTDAANNEALVDLPEPSPIYGAARLTGRLSDRLTIATLSAVTGANSVRVRAGDGTESDRVIEPLTAYNILRIKRDIGKTASVGVLATATNRFETAADYPEAPPGQRFCPDGTEVAGGARCFHDAYAAEIDARWRPGDYAISGQAYATRISEGPPQQLADGTTIQSGDGGVGGEVYLAKEGGLHWLASVFAGGVSRRTNFNDLGFMSRQNMVYGGTSLAYRTLTPWGPTRETSTAFETVGIANLDWLPQVRNARLSTTWQLRDFSSAYIGLQYRARVFDDREMGTGAALEFPPGIGVEVTYATDPRARLVGRIGVDTVQRADHSDRTGVDLGVTLRALPRLDIDVSGRYDLSQGQTRFVDFGAAPGEYLFGQLDATGISGTLRTTYTFTPRLILQGYAQLYLAKQHYRDFAAALADPMEIHPVIHLDDIQMSADLPSYNPDYQEGALNVHAVLLWEYRLGSTVSLVYSRRHFPSVELGPTDVARLELGSINRSLATDQLYVKLTYWWN